ncbi:hypothetical protein EAF04_006242 [Stromatinia cepivora]|nr:hypothetical protein EAF04_006242 [Stromatinia cepivora]
MLIHFHPLPIILAYLTLIPQTLSTAIPQSPSNPNPNLGTWHTLPPIPLSPRQEHTTIYLDPYIYILGGVTPSNDPNNPFPTTTLTQRYSLLTNTWSTAAPLPLPLNHANAAVLNGAIYLLGGLTPSPQNPNLWTAIRKSYIYRPETDIWSELPSEIPDGRQIGAAAVGRRGNTIYLAGGITHLDISQTYQPSVDYFTAYTAGRELWTTLPPLPQPRDHAGRAFMGDNGPFYVIGGREFGHYNIFNTTYAYDFQTNTWGEKAQMPTARAGVASAVVGNQIFVMGGEGNPDAENGVFSQNEAYDTLTDSWREYAPMDVPRHGTSAVAIGKRIYVPGGGIGDGSASTDYFSYFEVP